MIDKQILNDLFINHNFGDYKWIKASDIVIAHWVRLRCMYGCPSYGKSGTCPPNVPSIDECRKIMSEYSEAVVFHFEKKVAKPEDRKPWTKEMSLKLLQLEKAVFLEGYYKAFLIPFDGCVVCEKCSGNRIDCKNPQMARPGADAFGIDVFSTVRNAGFSIQVLKEYSDNMNRYAFLLIQ